MGDVIIALDYTQSIFQHGLEIFQLPDPRPFQDVPGRRFQWNHHPGWTGFFGPQKATLFIVEISKLEVEILSCIIDH